MNNLFFVSTNVGKQASVREKFEKLGVPVEIAGIELNEPEASDIEYIAKVKVSHAYNVLKQPCFAIDSGFCVDAFGTFPGTLVKRSGISLNPNLLLSLMENIENRKAQFVDCLIFYDGCEYYSFWGKDEGVISYELRGNDSKKARSKLWQVFIPKNHTKTLAEMTDTERENKKDGTSAIQMFAKWYKNVYQDQMVLKNSKK